ncbi:MAG: L-lactate permease [Candidatus Woesearchaeota archaeon]
MNKVLVLYALLPIILIFLLIVIMKWPASRAMPVAWLAAAIISILVWAVPVAGIIASSFKGVLVAIDILFIVFGALLLLKILQKGRAIEVIDYALAGLSQDRRVQAILVAWLFGSFVEGAAGFGTPAALAAPLLASIGFPAIAAVIVSLVANSTAVSFGAAGTPLIMGISTILPEQLKHLLPEISATSALLHAIIGTFVPLIMVCILTRFFGKNRSWKEGIAIAPYAIWAGLCFTIPYYLSARLFGPEVPSIIGGIAGLALLAITTRAGLFVPKTPWTFAGHKEKTLSFKTKLPVWKAFFPYILLGILLVITRIRELGIGEALKKVAISIPGAGYTFTPLYSPGFMFLIVCAVSWFLYGLSGKEAASSAANAFVPLKNPAISLVFAVAAVQLIMNSGNNISGLESMPAIIGSSLAVLGRLFVVLSPALGMLGSFIVGSNTVSNLLFGAFQLETALAVGLSPVLVLALQNVGGAVGNMISVHNIIAASATVGLHGEEGHIIRINLIPAISYALLAGIIGALLLL